MQGPTEGTSGRDDVESFELGQTPRLRVLVTGATGHQGRHLARVLVDRGHQVRGLTRDTDSPTAQELTDVGVEMVEGHFETPDTVRRAAEGMEAAFLMCTPYEQGPEKETEWAVDAADAIVDAGVPHIVYSSVASADRNTGIPHFESKMRVEEHVRDLGISYAIVAPVFFMDNFASAGFLPGLREGKLAMPLPENQSLQMIAVENVAEVCALALERRGNLVGTRTDIAGDELTGAEVKTILESMLEHNLTYEEVPVDAVREQQDDDQARMWAWFRETGYDVDVDGLRSRFHDVNWKGLSEWARAQDWQRLVETVAR